MEIATSWDPGRGVQGALCGAHVAARAAELATDEAVLDTPAALPAQCNPSLLTHSNCTSCVYSGGTAMDTVRRHDPWLTFQYSHFWWQNLHELVLPA